MRQGDKKYSKSTLEKEDKEVQGNIFSALFQSSFNSPFDEEHKEFIVMCQLPQTDNLSGSNLDFDSRVKSAFEKAEESGYSYAQGKGEKESNAMVSWM